MAKRLWIDFADINCHQISNFSAIRLNLDLPFFQLWSICELGKNRNISFVVL